MGRLVLRKARASGAPRTGAAPTARGLVLRASKKNPRVKRWERMGEPKSEPRPPSQQVDYRHPRSGETRSGRVHAGGAQGLSVVDHETGELHRVPHGHYVVSEGESGAAKPETKPEAKPEAKPKDWRATHPGLSRYPPKGVKDEDVEVGGDGDNHRLAWRHPDTGRRELAYDATFMKERARAKFAKMRGFADSLPTFRNEIGDHLELDHDAEQAVLATMALVVDRTLMRAGGKSATTFGVSTIRASHASVVGDEVVFRYAGKAGIPQRKVIKDARIAAVVGHLLHAAPEGGPLFQFRRNGGGWSPVGADRLRRYIKQGTGGTIKDFRTFHATRLFAEAADELGPPTSDEDADAKVQKAALRAAQELGHKKSSRHGHFIQVSSRATASLDRAPQHGGHHYGDGMVGFHTAAARDEYRATLRAKHSIVKGQARPDDRMTEFLDEVNTALANYIDPTVVEAYKQGLTLSSGAMRKGGRGALSPEERRFIGYLDRVETADPFGVNWAPAEDEEDGKDAQ